MNPSHGLDHLLSFALEQPWAITRTMLGMVASVLARRLAAADPPEWRSSVPPRSRSTSASTGIAVIPIYGVIAPRMNLLSDVSGGTSYQAIRKAVGEAVADPEVTTIVLDVDSPGGSCAGASECAQAIRAARERKPIIAQAEFSMNSAAYWICSGATAIVASPSAQVGSIGVFTIHEDLSAALVQLGVKATILSAGKYKVEGNPIEPLTPDARARIQRQVDATYGRFVSDVGKGRAVPVPAVRGGYGEGATVTADEALAAKMIDRVSTLEDTLRQLMTGPPPAARVATVSPPVLTEQTRRTLNAYRQQLARAAGGRLR